jgi:hypothetical protein
MFENFSTLAFFIRKNTFSNQIIYIFALVTNKHQLLFTNFLFSHGNSYFLSYPLVLVAV